MRCTRRKVNEVDEVQGGRGGEAAAGMRATAPDVALDAKAPEGAGVAVPVAMAVAAAEAEVAVPASSRPSATTPSWLARCSLAATGTTS